MAGPYSTYRGGGGGMPGGYAELLMEPGRAMGQGLADMGRSIGRALEVRKEKEKQAQLADKAAVAMFDAFQPAKSAEGAEQAHPFGVSRDQLLAMSRNDRVGLVKGAYDGMVMKNAMAEQAAQAQERQLRSEAMMRAANADLALERARRAATTERGMAMLPGSTTDVMLPGSTPFQGIPSQVKTQVPLTSERLLQAIGREPGAINRENLPEVLRLAAMGQTEGGLPYQPEPFNVNGMEGLVSPRTGAIHVKPTANEAVMEQRMEYLTVSGLQAKERALIAARSRVYTDQDRKDYDTQIADVQNELKRRMKTGREGSEVPQFKKGQRAVQGGVTYEFDGANWNATQ